jgi:hypothetical protein
MDKVRVINWSLRCFRLGWFGLVPILGIVPAAAAIVCHGRARTEAGAEWNPAAKFLFWGAVLAWIGLALSALVVGLTMMIILRSLR